MENDMYFVQWNDPMNSVCRKGAVKYKGKTVFNTIEEAREALGEDQAEELDYNPKSQMSWIIFKLPDPVSRSPQPPQA